MLDDLVKSFYDPQPCSRERNEFTERRGPAVSRHPLFANLPNAARTAGGCVGVYGKHEGGDRWHPGEGRA